MRTISLRLPDSLHDRVRKLAEQEGVSINQLITLALAEKLFSINH
jgi:predicted HicB family RNase H-like nuclease